MRRQALPRLLLAALVAVSAALSGCAAQKPAVRAESPVPEDSGLWVSTGEDPAWPKSDYVVGKGWSATSPDEAQRKAFAAVERQIGATVKSSQKLSKSEMALDGGETAVFERMESFASTRSEGELEGVKIVRERADANGHHALAVLNRAEFALATESKISELELRLGQALDAAARSVGAGDLPAALAAVADAPALFAERELLRRRLSAVAPGNAAALSLRSAAELDALYGRATTELSLALASGGGQKVPAGKPLADVVARVSLSGRPAAGIPVSLFPAPGKRAAATERTDADGAVRFSGIRLPEGSAPSVGIDLPVSGNWRKALRGKDVPLKCEIVPVSREVRLEIEAKGIDPAAVRSELAAAGFVESASASAPALRVRAAAEAAGRLDGLSTPTLVVKVAVEAASADASGRPLKKSSLVAQGYGPDEASAGAHALRAIRLGTLHSLFE